MGTTGTCPNDATNYPLCNTGGTPDLTITGSVTPSSAFLNTAAILTSSINNIGGGGTGGSFSSLFTITDNTAGTITLKPVTVPAISANSSGTASLSYTFTAIGTYSVRVCADAKDASIVGTITESNEENNCGNATTVTVTNSLPQPGTTAFQCNDGVDNDGDGLVDTADPECHAGGVLSGTYLPTYNSEQNGSTECNDTIDNDGDGLIDALDPECHVGGDINNGVYLPAHDSESTAATECNDGIDNDGDNLIDSADPACHVSGVLSGAYDSANDSEINAPVSANICLDIEQNPLTFTADEKAKLAVLLRRFYLISSTLRTADDISTIYDEIDQRKAFIAQIEELTNQCYDQADPLMASHPEWDRHGNPWYTPWAPAKSTGTFPYTNTNKISTVVPGLQEGYLKYDQLEGDTLPDKCKVVSGYYYGTMDSGADCSTQNNFALYGNCTIVDTRIYADFTNQLMQSMKAYQPDDAILKQGCKWKAGVILNNTERILNIW